MSLLVFQVPLSLNRLFTQSLFPILPWPGLFAALALRSALRKSATPCTADSCYDESEAMERPGNVSSCEHIGGFFNWNQLTLQLIPRLLAALTAAQPTQALDMGLFQFVSAAVGLLCEDLQTENVSAIALVFSVWSQWKELSSRRPLAKGSLI